MSSSPVSPRRIRDEGVPLRVVHIVLVFVRFNVSRTGARGGILGDESERLKRRWDVPAFFFRMDATEETEDSVEEDDTLP